jgi:hypothetical protein
MSKLIKLFGNNTVTSPSNRDLAVINFNGPELMNHISWMKERGLSKNIGNVTKKGRGLSKKKSQ